LKDDNNEPLNSNKKLMGCVNKATITVSGKGVLVGEEILQTKNEYKFSVKVIFLFDWKLIFTL